MYQDRHAAGERLAEELAARNFPSVSILAVPRGGIFVAVPIAERLNVALEILVTRKLGHPANPEVAIGAVMPDGSVVLDHQLIEASGISGNVLERIIAAEYAELQRRMKLYSGSAELPSVAGRTAVIVDDGIATGYTARAAIRWLRTLQPAKIVVAVPVAPPEIVQELARDADDIICLLQPEIFRSVGQYYRDFPQNTDAEVLMILRRIKH